MDENLRRSGRQRTATHRYANDVSHLVDSSDSATGETNAKKAHASDFDGTVEQASVSLQDEASSSGEAPSDDGGSDLGSRKARRTDRRRLRKATDKLPDSQHARGLTASLSKLSKISEVSRILVGNDSKEQELLADKLGRWALDGIFPTRDHMSPPNAEDGDAMIASWRWYTHDGGRENFNRMQSTRALSHDEGLQYFPPRHPVHKAVLGPSWQEKLYHLALHEPLHISNTYESAATPTIGETQDGTSPLGSNGWILNLGAKIQSVSWAALHESHQQFLAVALDHPSPHSERIETAFEPSATFKSCIQIWSFQSQQVDDASATLNPDQPPSLIHVVCSEWGMCKEVKWCPFPKLEAEDGPQIHIGFLASIWSDGYVRVLDIKIPQATPVDALYVSYEEAAFAARSPNTICSSASWSSPRDLLVGCANGSIAAWNIAKAAAEQLKKERTNSTELNMPQPYLHHRLHDTYVLGVEHCVPNFPWLLISLSADGTYRLCDLRNPGFDTTDSRRYRAYPSDFEYCPHMLSAITADGYNGVALRPLRHFLPDLYVTFGNARISAIACGRAHPHSLVGLVDGTAMAFNTAPQLFRHRSSRKRWGTVWFKHEWRPEEDLETERQTSNGDANGISHSRAYDIRNVQSTSNALRKGVSRITEAFEPYMYSQNPHFTSTKKGSAGGRTGPLPWETIFEEPSAITQLKWNPNLRCGGWAAAGMGSGLLRVEDLAI